MTEGDLKGRRLRDTVFGELPDHYLPCDFWKYTAEDGRPMESSVEGNLTGTVWGFCAPTGEVGLLMSHTVREHDDGSISVRPNDGSSNSIAIKRGDVERWHGYVEHGVWKHV